MKSYKTPKKAEIIYFSGTGGTEKAAKQFALAFAEKNVEVISHEIHCRNRYTPEKADLLLVLYPVYAFNAPRPVYEFIKKLPQGEGRPAAVISISGGGEVTPNKACRLHCIRRLEKKGYLVVYEAMLVMPSNVFIPTPEELSIRLLEVLPSKVQYIVNSLMSGVIRRTKPDLLNRMLACIGDLEKTRIGGRFYGRHFKADKKCTGCGICEKGCPTGNITMHNKRPVFDHQCSICLKCIYNCPKKALRPAFAKFIVLKKGYRLKSWERRTDGMILHPLDETAKGYSMSGIKKYLLEED